MLRQPYEICTYAPIILVRTTPRKLFFKKKKLFLCNTVHKILYNTSKRNLTQDPGKKNTTP